MATATTDPNRSLVVKKKRIQAEQKLSTELKKLWVQLPTCDILLVFVHETFQSKVKHLSKLPINDFIRYYNSRLEKGWMKRIIGNLVPFITFLSDPGKHINTSLAIDNASGIHTSCLSFFETKLNDMTGTYQATKDNLLSAVQNSFNARVATEPHPITVFLTSDHDEMKRHHKEDDWLLYFLGCNEAGKKHKKLEYNVRIIVTILYSILCSTRDYIAIDVLARSLGAKAKKIENRRRFLNRIAHETIKEYLEMKHTDDATASTTTAPLFQSSQSNDSLQSRHPRVVPSVIIKNYKNDSTTTLRKKINPMKCSRAVVDETSHTAA